MMIRLIFVSFTLTFLFGCTLFQPSEPTIDYTETDAYAASVTDQLSEANLEFALKSFKELVNQEQEDKNIFCSPISLTIALAMAYNGARENTADVMAEGMKLQNMTLNEVNEQFMNLIYSLQYCDDEVQLNIANSMWVDNEYQVADDYTQILVDYYLAEVFSGSLASQETVDAINKWVSDKTNGKIRNMYERGLNPYAALLLINALYFKADWKMKFDEKCTSNMPFYQIDGSMTTVQMMENSSKGFTYYNGGSFNAVRMPYGRDVVAMYVFLPFEGLNVDDFIENLTSVNWNRWMESFVETDYTLKFPKFKMEYEKEFRDVLEVLGMDLIFTQYCNFTGITGRADRNLMIFDVKQKAFIEVNEDGTEAAAATGVTMGPTAPPPGFCINRPFFFVIKDDRSETILFMGRIMNPQYE